MWIQDTESGEISRVTPEEYISMSDKESYQVLTNSNLLYLRANSPDFAFRNEILSVVHNGTSIKEITEQLQKVANHIGTTTLKEEDTVVIASPIYEGIELTSTKIFDDIAKVGSKLIILSKKFLSPHASREDILMMINLMQPKYFMPVNGEYRCQVEAVNAAKVIGYDDSNTLLRLNGQATTFINGKLVDNGETIKVDDVFIDGKDTSDIGDMVLKDRELLADNGIVIVTATIDKATKKILAKPIIMTKGFVFVKDNIDLIKEAEKISLEILESNIKGYYVDYSKVKYGIRDKLGKYFYNETECKPMIIVVMQEI